MKRIKIVLMAVVFFGIIGATLLYNKSRMEATSRREILHAVPVSVGTVSKMTLSDTHSLTGTIAANKDVPIISETEGRVTAVLCKVGDFRQAGSEIVRVEDELKKAAYTSAEVSFEKSKRDLERFESLHNEHAVTDQQYETARLAQKSAEAQYIIARKQLNDTRITTPVSGIVTSRLVDVGTMVQSKMQIANVVDISTLRVKLNLSEQDAFRLHSGDSAEITTAVYPGVTFMGRIESISDKGDESHTYPVEILLKNNKEHPLKAGMFSRVSFTTLSHEPVVAIPRESLVGSVKRPQVYIVENDVAKLRDIVVDGEVGTNLVVRSGLLPGERIVLNGQNNLKDNVPVTISGGNLP